ncbi:unnamed protein product [Tilletia caries]|uniref:CUE domain-containing protein n=2 Tax=Tilletia TaxID=13289 RepID=A0ABN7J960_9BASI|nr:unnamed protein product [Tilletia caries]CAD6957535.1 unnamed protein product [Tilletia caries]
MVNTTVTRLAELTGLDNESVESQLLPFLSTFTSPASLRVHLVDLLGSSEQAASFISQYVAQRFPNAPRSQPQPSSSQPRQQQAKQHGKQKLTPKQRLLQPATAKRVVKETPEAFGPIGTVYHKDKDFVLDGYRRPAVISAPHGPASVPTPPPTSENEAASTSYQQPTLIAAAEQQPTADIPAPELETIAPTAAMRELDALLAELVVSEDNQGSAPPELVLCFCQGSSGTSSPFMTSSHSHPPTGTYGMAGYGPRSNAVAIALGRRAPTENERAALQQRTHRVLRIPTKGAPPAKRASKKSKKVKAEGAKNASKESAARNNTATPTAAVVTPDEADESDDDDDADADLGSSAVEVTITILVPDTDDDGWPALAHQAPSSLSSAADVDDAQQAAIQRQRAMARTVGGHRLLANPRLEAGSRPTYTARKEREARRAAWLAAGEDGGDHDE